MMKVYDKAQALRMLYRLTLKAEVFLFQKSF